MLLFDHKEIYSESRLRETITFTKRAHSEWNKLTWQHDITIKVNRTG